MKYILALLLILFASYADIFLFRMGLAPAEPAYFFIPLFLLIAAVKYSILDIVDIFKSHTFKFLALVIFLSILFASFSPADAETITTKTTLNIITLFLYVYTVQFFRKEDRKLVILVISLAFISIAGSVIYDFIIGLPITNKKLIDAVRKGGFGENPNQAASAIKFLAFGLLVFLPNHKKMRYTVIVAMAIAVFLTMSRSGILSVILIIIIGTANSWQSKFKITIPNLIKSSFQMIFIFFSLFIGLVLLSGVIKENFPAFTRGEAGKRLDLLTGKSESRSISKDVSGGGRGNLAIEYLNKFLKKPFGYGTAYTSSRRHNPLNTHNYYLLLAVNYGFIALILYMVYLLVGLNLAIKYDQFYYFIFIILILFEGLISHSIYHERALLISLAFFDSFIYNKE